MWNFQRLLMGGLVLGICACTNTNRFSYKQVNLTEEQIKQTVARAPQSFKDSTITFALGPRYKRHALHRWVWGERNRDLWQIPVTFPVLDMATEKGGLTPKKRGGGFQTKSLRFENKAGHEYVIRSIDKEPVTALPGFLQKTFLAGIVRDQTSAMNPYGPLVVPGLARAAGIFYTQPRYLYLPHDPKLGEYLNDFAGMVGLLEPDPEEDHPELKKFGVTGEVENSADALEKRYQSHKYTVDQRMFARARLFDIWIGDWDRHEGQWTWAEFKHGNRIIFKPIPEDRDQVFYKLDDGWLSWILTLVGPLRKLQTFDSGRIDVSSYIRNAEFIDKRMLNELSRQDWMEIADSLQHSLTDTAISAALKALPEPIYAKKAGHLFATLTARRKQLPSVASQFYALLARKVEVVGTQENERFLVTRLNDNETLVQIFSLEDDQKENLVFSRKFLRTETKQLTLYGLRGEDIFELSGEVGKSILVNIVGGMGDDVVTDKSRVSGWSHKTRVYDTRFGVEITGREASNKTTRNITVNAYDEEGK